MADLWDAIVAAIKGGHIGAEELRQSGSPEAETFVQRVIAERGGNVRPLPGMVEPVVGPSPLGKVSGGLTKIVETMTKESPEAFNLRVLKQVAPPGFADKITEAGPTGVKQLQTAFKEAYGSIQNLKAVVDDQLIGDFEKIRKGLLSEGATPAEQDKFLTIVKEQVIGRADDNGELLGDAAQNAQSMLGKLGAKFSGKTATVNEKALGHALLDARSAYQDALVRGTPEAAAELSSINAQYPGLLAINDAAAKAPGSIFTPAQLKSAISRDTSKAVVARGEANLQPATETALEQGVGQESALQKGIKQLWIAGPIAAKAVPSVENIVGKAITPTLELGAGGGLTIEDQRAQIAAGNVATQRPIVNDVPDFVPPPMPDMDQFIQQNTGAPQFDQNEMDGFINRHLREMHIDKLSSAIEDQESGGRNVVSPAGARGPMQIMPGTFRQYARPGENIDDPWANRRVGRRLISSLYDKYGDPRAVASAYFSGQPNYNAITSDVTGKRTVSYVHDVMKRLSNA